MIIANTVLLIKEMIDKLFKEMMVGMEYIIVFPLKIIFQNTANLSFADVFGFMIFTCFPESYIIIQEANSHLKPNCLT